MDKARTVTDTKTLQGEDLDKRNSYSASISLNYCETPITSEVTSIFVDNQKFVVDNQKFVLTIRNLC